MAVLKQLRTEMKEVVLNPALVTIVILPIIMSKIIGYSMAKSGIDMLLVSVWILFAQVMIGIMITAPGLIEERETKTLDALLCTPLSFTEILISKCGTILLFSILSQAAVLVLNNGVTTDIFEIIFPMLLGAIVFIEIGVIIGLTMKSSKVGSAVSSVVMIALFLIVSVYPSLPEWTYSLFVLLPSVEVVEIISALLDGQKLLLLESGLLLGWVALLSIVIGFIAKKKY